MKRKAVLLLSVMYMMTSSVPVYSENAKVGMPSNLTEEHALERSEEYAKAIDYSYKEPEVIYRLLCKEFRGQMTEDEFCKAFEKERTYPYITPLYISKPRVTMERDLTKGTVIYDQAARIIGMTYEVELIYEDGDYYICDWESFADGSYLEKFENTPYSLEWYYDVDEIK
ncbi:MAG: hypothetical protein HUJ72_04370 [Blautia sp.]|nr:hypothetical protein [Blautia sp.]